MKKIMFGLLLCVSLCSVLSAEEQDLVKTGLELNFVAATTKEAKMKISGWVQKPFLTGSGPLLSGNNIRLRAAGEVSPVSLNAVFDASLTPIAFLNFSTAAFIGSGWNIPIADGLRINSPVEGAPGKQSLTGDAFDGLVWGVKSGGTFQFDFAALVPGDWNHVVLQTYHGIQYRANTAAGKDESWLFESDAGQNRNGSSYYGNLFLGYQMPIVLNTAGVLVEYDKYLYETEGSDSWGEDLGRWTFGSLCNFTVTKRLAAAVLIQMKSTVQYTDATKDNEFYQNRKVVDSNPLKVEFYRAALNMTYKLK